MAVAYDSIPIAADVDALLVSDIDRDGSRRIRIPPLRYITSVFVVWFTF